MHDNTLILHIAIPSPRYNHFDYLPPVGVTPEQLHIGMRLHVPFGRREVIGILLGCSTHSDLAPAKLKPAIALCDTDALLPEPILALCRWAAQYYHHPLGDVLACALPTLLRQGKPAAFLQQAFYRLNTQGLAALTQSHKKTKAHALLQLLQQHPHGLAATVLKQQGYAADTLRRALEKGWVDRIDRASEPTHTHATAAAVTLQLNAAQQQAVTTISAHLQQFTPFLLHGITGSGKTEVYLRCIEQCIAQGKQALVLIPEIALTPQTAARFTQYFHTQHVVILHSGLSDRERLDAWLLCQQNKSPIVIGTRSAVFTPLPQLGIIIIDEEHDSSFKQQEGFRYCARSLAIMRAQHNQIPILLGSATPSLESFYNSQQQRFHYLALPIRATGASLPRMNLIDLRQHPLQQGLTKPLLDAITQHLALDNQVLLFINRRGFAPVLLCHDCGWSASCAHCDAKMVRHFSTNLLQCHHCGSSRRSVSRCPQCHGTQLIAVGAGTERIEHILQEKFPNAGIVRVDRDTTRGKGNLHALLAEIQHGNKQILLGTQMLAKGHHFPQLALVGILDADSGLYSSDFRATERMAQLLLQVAGRAGREDKPGEVLIQTHNPDHPLLHCLLKEGYVAFVQAALQERQLTQLPPFSYLALLRVETPLEATGLTFLECLKNQLPSTQHTHVLGPIPAVMQRKAGRFRAQLLIKASQRNSLHRLLDQLITHLQNTKLPPQLRWQLDVDPQELL